jgi:hypothetical protein
MWTEQDDKELEYGTWHVFDAKSCRAEEQKIRPPKEVDERWPRWAEGRPTKFLRICGSEPFYRNKVDHRYTTIVVSMELDWNPARTLPALKQNYRLLPSDNTWAWSGVYRIFSPDVVIDRCCGKDPTGTLYVGRAGTRGRGWSILRTRVMSIATREHHAIKNWCDGRANNRFPWHSLSVEWAVTGQRMDYKGDREPEAILAEKWLLASYNDSYGEYPPWNQRGH